MTPMKRIYLSELSYDHLEEINAWRVIMDSLDDDDASLVPAFFNANGEITAQNEEVWCLCTATFHNGTTHNACAMCRGDSNDGPLLWTFWNGERDVSLQLPPSPPPVLKVDGPIPFAKAFGWEVSDVFPIQLEVVPKFEEYPAERKILLLAN